MRFIRTWNFTIERFDDDKVYFLDILIDKTKTYLYYKPTHVGQNPNITINARWNYKAAWIEVLYHLAKNICSRKQNFLWQIKNIKKFILLNEYPLYTRNSILKRLNYKNNNKNKNETVSEVKTIWVRLPYLYDKEDELKRRYVKIYLCLTEKVYFQAKYNTKIISLCCSLSDKIPNNQKANAIYFITCSRLSTSLTIGILFRGVLYQENSAQDKRLFESTT